MRAGRPGRSRRARTSTAARRPRRGRARCRRSASCRRRPGSCGRCPRSAPSRAPGTSSAAAPPRSGATRSRPAGDRAGRSDRARASRAEGRPPSRARSTAAGSGRAARAGRSRPRRQLPPDARERDRSWRVLSVEVGQEGADPRGDVVWYRPGAACDRLAWSTRADRMLTPPSPPRSGRGRARPHDRARRRPGGSTRIARAAPVPAGPHRRAA